MLPQFVIIGGQKCGTTYLASVLRQHPSIHLPKQEVPFFQTPDYNPDRIEDYFNKLSGETKKIFGIKRPDYLGIPGVEKRIAKNIPNAKIIVILRNPSNRLRSAYFHSMKTGFIPINELNKGVTLLLNGEYQKKYPNSARIIDYGFYYKHLKRYFSLFPKKNIKVIIYDNLKKDPGKTIAGVLKFLGVDYRYNLNYLLNPQKGIYSITRLRFRKIFLPLLYTYNKGKTRLQIRTGIPGFLGKFLHAFDIIFLSNFFVQDPPNFNNQVSNQLRGLYERDIFKLQRLLKTNLSFWLAEK